MGRHVANRNIRNEAAVRIGRAIRSLRERRGLTQQALADVLGVERTTVAGWELGRRMPDAATIERIAGALGTPVETIVRPAQLPVRHLSVEEDLRRLRAMLRGFGATDEDMRIIMHLLRVRQEQIKEQIGQQQEGDNGH